MPAISGGAADIVYRLGGRCDQLAEAAQGRITGRSPPIPIELTRNEGLRVDRAQRGRPRRADSRPYSPPRRVDGQREGADGDDHGVTGADLGELLRPRRRLDQKRRDQLVLAHRVALGPGEDLADRDSARSRRGGELDFRVRREERRMSVAGRRGGSEVAANRAAVSNLRRADST